LVDECQKVDECRLVSDGVRACPHAQCTVRARNDVGMGALNPKP